MTRRTALVTGANRGIGLAIAQGLAARGDIHVLAASRDATKAEAAALAVGGGAVGVVLDVSDPVDAEVCARVIEADHGPIDILINNAGILIDGNAVETRTADLARTLAVNTVAPFALTRALGPGMKSRGWGRIVNVSSALGSFDEGLGGPASYSISKAALNAVTVTFAPVLGPEVKVNSASPGWVRTAMGGDAAPLSPEEGADTPIWLATLPDDGPTGSFFRDRRPFAW
ncbi:MAG: SDR family NAD(P)-dependent oxidoreductase [Acidobacteriota bacterium]